MTDINQRLAGLSPEKRALLLQQLAKQGAAKARPGIPRRARPERIPVSFAQQRLWILDQLEPNSAAYNVPSSMWLHGQLDVALLERVLAEIVRRHEALRTVIGSDAHGPFQRINPSAAVPITLHDLSHLPTAEQRPAAHALACGDAQRPFDLARGPLFRAALFKLNPTEHLFLLNAHHIVVDGWSFGIIFKELSELYQAFGAGQSSPLAEPPIQYVDFTLWQRELLAEGTPALEQQLAYWQEQLAGQLPVLELPGDRPRPPVQTNHGAMLCHVIAPVDYEPLKNLARNEGATPFMVFAALYLVLLARYAGQSDLILGVGLANRTRLELEPLVGFFVNTLALRADLSGNPTFRQLLARIKTSTLGAYAHQDLPVERLLEALELDRTLSHSALFQAMLFFQNYPNQDIELPGLRLAPVEAGSIESGTARTDLTLFANEQDGGLTLYFEYATDLFDEATIKAFARQLQHLMRDVVRQPDQQLAYLDILPPEERQTLLYHWNATAHPIDSSATVQGLVEAQAAKTPDAIAVSGQGRQISYRELDQRANALARQLIAEGVQPGQLVGLYLHRSPDLLPAMLGILKAGAAYVPMDPAFPADRLGFMLEDAELKVVVTARSSSATLPTSATHPVARVLIDQIGLSPDAPPVAHDPNRLVYVIFTSGSTGRPKGVLLPQRAVVNFLHAMAAEPGLTASDTLLAVTTLSFDIAVLELWLPLTLGARIELVDSQCAADGPELARLLDSSGASVMQATPATWRMLLDAGWHPRASLKMLCGGEAMSHELAERLLAGGAALWNMYGPTETAVWSCIERVMPGAGNISVGMPIANTQVYIVDPQLQPVPVGVPGELLIGGLGVASGYLGQADLTAEKFIANPWSTDPAQARLYRTGDLARRTRDGKIEVLGRIDNQIKLRGYRIEPGEIEAVLEQHESVRQAVVVCREDRPGDKRLVAYLILQTPEAEIGQPLRQFLQARLPDYMQPSAWVSLARFPQTPNGKIDRRALPKPDMAAQEAASYSAPRNAEETSLCQIWADVLGLEQVGIDADFFKLGGHSLSATQLIMRVNAAFHTALGLRTLFEAPSVAAFAELLMRERLGSVDDSALLGMLDQLDGLSEAEIEAMLANEGELV
jgi:amino acid adenylation domain-containing protein